MQLTKKKFYKLKSEEKFIENLMKNIFVKKKVKPNDMFLANYSIQKNIYKIYFLYCKIPLIR